MSGLFKASVIRRLVAVTLGGLLWGSALSAGAAGAGSAASALAEGRAYRQQGQLTLAITRLREARDAATTSAERQPALAELGATLLQARQFEPAAAALTEAHALAQGVPRAAVALDLGNLAALRGLPDAARLRHEEALQLGGGDAGIRFAARLNLARLAAPAQRLALLTSLAQDQAPLADSAAQARRQLALAQQARLLGEPGLALAYAQAERARRWASTAGDSRLLAEALDTQAQLYENRGRSAEALALTRQGLAATAALPPGLAGDLPIQLEWRQARLTGSLNQPAASLAAYQRAVRHIEALRQDIPIDDETGNSSFRTMLEPVYLGLVQSLLAAADAAPAAQGAGHLRQVIDTVELIRQTELQDYLGDRCDVDAVKGGTATVIPPGTGVLYPIVLADRLELLLETAGGITRQRSPVPARSVRDTAKLFAEQLRAGRRAYLTQAGQLYDWVFRPLEPAFAAQGITTLVVVPDGALRLVAVGAFHDGRQFAIEKFAITTATGMSMTNTASSAPRAGSGFLLAGLSSPGPVVGKLSGATVARLLGPQAAAALPAETVAVTRSSGLQPAAPATSRSSETAGTTTMAVVAPDAPDLDADARIRALREALALPGVNAEVEAIGRIAPTTRLLNQDFTVNGFRRAAESGDYSIVHVASHGVFGGSAEASYILAYDDLLTLDGLQSLLRSDRFRRNPIELLSLSACETAEGDERSPLGISGAAMKARAKSVMGSLWPVSDEAAVRLMAQFYSGLLGEGLSKAQALQRSQVAMLRSRDFAHPFFWAPFILIGNWL